jgi:stage III sporulation protein AE
VLSLQQMVAVAGDSVSSRAVKFSLASLVPVVGGVLSEAYATVMGCAGLLRSTVGGFGVVSTLAIILPPLLSCIGWNFCLSLAANAAALFKLDALDKLCRCIAGATRVLVAVLAALGLMMIVSTSVIVFAGRR